MYDVVSKERSNTRYAYALQGVSINKFHKCIYSCSAFCGERAEQTKGADMKPTKQEIEAILKEVIKEDPPEYTEHLRTAIEQGFRAGETAEYDRSHEEELKLGKEIANLKEELEKWKSLYGDNHYEKQLTEANHNLLVWKNRSKEFEKEYYAKQEELADTKGKFAEAKKELQKWMEEAGHSALIGVGDRAEVLKLKKELNQERLLREEFIDAVEGQLNLELKRILRQQKRVEDTVMWKHYDVMQDELLEVWQIVRDLIEKKLRKKEKEMEVKP